MRGRTLRFNVNKFLLLDTFFFGILASIHTTFYIRCCSVACESAVNLIVEGEYDYTDTEVYLMSLFLFLPALTRQSLPDGSQSRPDTGFVGLQIVTLHLVSTHESSG